MLGRLIKYEMKSIVRVMVPVYIGLLALSVWAKVMLSMDSKTGDKQLLTLIAGISVFALVIMCLATEIITIIVIVKRFYKSVLCDEGYLTNTLPVQSETIIISKVIAAFLWVVISAVVLYFSCIILAEKNNPADSVYDMMSVNAISGLFKISADDVSTKTKVYIASILCIFAETLHFYAAMCLGNLLSKHKVLGAFAAFIGLTIVFSILNGILSISLAINVVETSSLVLFSSRQIIVRSIGYVIQIAAYFVITDYVLKKRLNLE